LWSTFFPLLAQSAIGRNFNRAHVAQAEILHT